MSLLLFIYLSIHTLTQPLLVSVKSDLSFVHQHSANNLHTNLPLEPDVVLRTSHDDWPIYNISIWIILCIRLSSIMDIWKFTFIFWAFIYFFKYKFVFIMDHFVFTIFTIFYNASTSLSLSFLFFSIKSS